MQRSPTSVRLGLSPSPRAGLIGALLATSMAMGCRVGWEPIDVDVVKRLRLDFKTGEKYSIREESPPPEEKPSTGSVILGEVLAIFPGVLIHGIGHYYAGDYKTARQISHVGQLGYIATAIGGGLLIGGYYLDKADDYTGFAYTLYGTGGVVGAVGVGYLLVAWFYDMIDTPRAVLSGGKPPPKSDFVEALDVFD